MFTLVLLGLVAVGGGQILEARAAGLVADRLSVSTAGASDVDVELSGFPLAFRAVAGRIPDATIEIGEVTVREPRVTFDPVVLELHGVRFDPFELALGQTGVVTVQDGTASATLSAEELSVLFGERGSGWDLRIDGGRLVASGSVRDVHVRVVAAIEVVEDSLRVKAQEVAVDGEVPAAAVAGAFDRDIPLPDLPGRVRLTEAEVGREGVVLRAAIRGTLDLGTS